MEKKNNEGKTFADIFSTIENDSIDFNSVNNIINNKELDNKSTPQKEESKESFNNSNSIFEKAVAEEKKISSSSIFDKAIKEEKESIEEKESNDDVISVSDIFSKAIKENNKTNEEEKETSNNIFENEEVIEEKETNHTEENDIFSSNESTKERDNIFFNNEDTTEEKETSQTEENDIFSSNESTKESDNIFFNNEENIDEKTNTTDKNTVKETEPDNNLEIDNSPFFQDDSTVSSTNTTEENPFFNNNINLVESNKHSTNELTGKIDVSNVQNFDVKIRKKRPSLIQSIIGVLSYATFIFLLLIGLALLVYVLDIKIRAAKGDNSPPKYGAYVVLTGSMLPEIQVYDVVITKQVDAKTLEEGDVITFASSDTRFAGTIITHRIIKKNYSSKTKSYTFQTKGDNNNVADSALVTPENIFGRVIFKIPKLGYLRDFLASRGGWIIVILLPCLAVVSYDIVKIAKGMKKKKYKNLVQSK